MHLFLIVAAACTAVVNGHLSAWHKGMYCLNGNSRSAIDLNTASPVTPLYQLSKNDWWFHHVNQCDEFPPAEGDFLDLPAGGSFTIEIASNRAKTSLSYNGKYASDWPDGSTYPADYNVPSCITSPNIHAQNRSMAAGTAFAISYQSDIKRVTAENLVVFTVRHHTPWLRVTSYDVPSDLPECPPGGCTCGWGWVPNGCGQPNIYHQAFKCRVTQAKSNKAVAVGKPPVWCEGDPSKCTKGAKQMIYWNQNEGNNIWVDGYDMSGGFKSPAYNTKLGFTDGAQNDIFVDAPVTPVPAPAPAPAPAPSSSSSPQPTTNTPTPAVQPEPVNEPVTSLGSGSGASSSTFPSPATTSPVSNLPENGAPPSPISIPAPSVITTTVSAASASILPVYDSPPTPAGDVTSTAAAPPVPSPPTGSGSGSGRKCKHRPSLLQQSTKANPSTRRMSRHHHRFPRKAW